MIHSSPQFLTYGAPPNLGPHTALHVSTSSFFLTYCHPPHAGTALHTNWLSPHSFCLTVLLLIRNPHLLQVSMPRFWPMHSSSLRTLHCAPNEYVCIISDMLCSSVLHPIPLQMSISAYMLIYCIPPYSRPPLVSKWESLPSFGPINSSSLTTPELAIENLLLISDLLPIFSIRKPPSV